MAKDKEYSEKNIKHYEGVKAVQKRPGMYVGVGTEAINQLVYEILSNSIDESLGGHCSKIDVILEKDNSISISDNGRGIPYKTIDHKGVKMSAAELICTSLHAGGKMDTEAYAVSAGTNGVGATCVNALSDWFKMEIHRDKMIHTLEFTNGVVSKPCKKTGTSKKTGSTISFLPSIKFLPEFEEEGFNSERIKGILRTTSYLNPGLTLSIHDKLNGKKKEIFKSENGVVDFVNDHNKEKSVIQETLVIHGDHKDVEADIAFTWNNSEKENIYGFVNGLMVPIGTHVTGYKLALSKNIMKYIKENDMLKGKFSKLEITGDDTREGLVCIISVRLATPQFHSQTKDTLGNREAQGATQYLTGQFLDDLFQSNPQLAKAICNRTIAAARARIAATAARNTVRKDVLKSNDLGLSAKLKDCLSKNAEECELYITEG